MIKSITSPLLLVIWIVTYFVEKPIVETGWRIWEHETDSEYLFIFGE